MDTSSTALTPNERLLLTRVAERHQGKPRDSDSMQGISHLLAPALHAVAERSYRGPEAGNLIIKAITKGCLLLDKPPHAWSPLEWGTVRRQYGDKCQLLLIVVAAKGYGIMPGRDYNAPQNTPRLTLAKALFGKDVEDAFNRVRAALISMGYHLRTREGTIRQCLADLLLFNGSPTLEQLSDDCLAEYIGHAPSRSARRAIATISGALVHMDIVTKRVTFFRPRERIIHSERLGVTVEWLEWCKRWHATSPVAERTRRGTFGDLMNAGRWLKRYYPEIRTPDQWTLDLAFQYVRFINAMRVGELLKGPRPNLRMGQPLTPNGKISALSSIRCFFRDLQNWEWIERRFPPDRGFAVPRDVRRSVERNPRPIDEGFWVKLRAASLSLRPEDLSLPIDRGQWRHPHPFEMVRALAIVWTFSGCRSNEIERLEVGCVYIEHIPEQTDPRTGAATPAFDQPMLRVPVNKTRGEFVKPVEAPLLEAIEAWELVRPAQPATLDETTGRLVHHLFSVRGRRVGHGIVNTSIIPMLLRKAGVPDHDSRGPITSHRARATMASKLYNGASGLGPLEVMSWLGHTHFASTQYYLALTPVRLMTAFHKSAKLTESLRMVSVVVDSRPEPGQSPLHYDLGHGSCSNPAYAMCAHRMACARCSFYEPADVLMETISRQKGRFVRMLQELDLTEDERAAVSGDAEAADRLLSRLAARPTPDLGGEGEALVGKEVAIAKLTARKT
jgi:hypothetical protein